MNQELRITKKHKKNYSRPTSYFLFPISITGQSLFEVIIAIGIAAMVLVGVVSLSTTSVRNTNFAKNDSVATKYAQEGSEFLREQRDSNWTTFITNYVGKPCLGAGFLTGAANCPIDTTYSRSLQFDCNYTNTTTGVVTVKVCNDPTVNVVNSVVIVSWIDGQGTHSVRSATTLTRWH